MRKYTIVLTRDEDDPNIFNATVPALPGCHTWGNSEDEAYKNAEEAIRLYLDAMNEQNQPIPEEAGQRVVVMA